MPRGVRSGGVTRVTRRGVYDSRTLEAASGDSGGAESCAASRPRPVKKESDIPAPDGEATEGGSVASDECLCFLPELVDPDPAAGDAMAAAPMVGVRSSAGAGTRPTRNECRTPDPDSAWILSLSARTVMKPSCPTPDTCTCARSLWNMGARETGPAWASSIAAGFTRGSVSTVQACPLGILLETSSLSVSRMLSALLSRPSSDRIGLKLS